MAFSMVLIAATVFTCSLLILKHLYFVRTFPSAPGPCLGKVSRWWYVWRAWKGDFETWSVNQHAIQGKIIRITPEMYSIDDPDAIETIYGSSSNMPKSDWYRVWQRPGPPNANLFSATDDKFHTQMRKMVVRLYSLPAIRAYEFHVDRYISSLLHHFEDLESTKETFNLQRWMYSFTFDILGEMTFSTTFGFMASGAQDIDNIMGNMESRNLLFTTCGIQRSIVPIMLAMYGKRLVGLYHWVGKLAETRRLEGDSNFHSSGDFYSKVEAICEKNPTDADTYHVRSILPQNILAGGESTTITLTAILFYLAKNRAVLARLRSEIWEAERSGMVSSPISFEEAQRLSYLQYVVKESLRIHPPVGLPLWRVVKEPGRMISDQYFPVGSVVGINIWVAHRNKNVFGPDADEFRPERWDPSTTSEERLRQMSRYYFPFGAGSRKCTGSNISLLQISKLVPEIVRRYDIELLSDRMETVNHWFVMQRDVMVRLKKRSEAPETSHPYSCIV